MALFGIMAWADSQAPIINIGSMARIIEQLGFNTFWLWDTPLYTKDPYVGLTLAALNTNKLLLGPGVSNSLTRHKSVLVNSISTLDDVSNGRTILGFGRGAPGSANVLGFPTPTISSYRRNLMDMHSLLMGRYIQTDVATQFNIPAVVRKIPIHTAAWGPRMLQTTGELADGALIAGEAQKLAFEKKIDIVQTAARRVGRDPKDVWINLHFPVMVDPDPEVAVDLLRPVVAYTIMRSPIALLDDVPPEHAEHIERIRQHYRLGTAPSQRTNNLRDLVPDSLVRYWAVVGTAEECNERLKDILTLRPDEVTFVISYQDMVDRLERFADLIQIR